MHLYNKKMKQIILFLLLIVSTIRLSAQSEEWLAYSHLQNDVNRAFSKSDYPKAVPIDTLYIPHNIGHEFSFYSAVEKTQVNTYFSKDYAGHAILHYCVNSLYPTTSFVLDNTFSNYFVVDRNKIIVKYVNDDQMYALDSLSNVTKIIEMNIGTENEEPFMLTTNNWVLFLLWLHPFILSGVISPLISSSILGTYQSEKYIFQCRIFLPFHTVQGFLVQEY